MKKIIFVILVITIVLFFTLGCTEMTREEKNTCYYLTSKSFAYIPNCETESSCYQKIDLLFNKSPNQSQESKLYEIKNDFARSWFFYNKSIKEINNISKSCQNGQASALPGQINQTSFYLEKSLKEMEEGIKNSLESIAILEESLAKDKIDLLKEEELFANLIELRQILADLETGNTKNNNYLSYYFNKIETYNASEAGKGNWLIEKDSALMRTYTFYKESFIQSSNEAELPAMSNYLIKSIPALESIFYTYQSLNELKKIPTEKFMRLYSEISGIENSVLKKYAELINKISKNQIIIENEIQQYWKRVEQLEKECVELSINIKNGKKYPLIEEKLMSGEIIKSNETEKMLNALVEKKHSTKINKTPLGEELFKLKQIENGFTELKKMLIQKENLEINIMKEKCTAKAREIENEKNKNEEIKKIYDELMFLSKKTLEKNYTLEYCNQMLEKEVDYRLGLSDIEKLKAQKITLTKNCFEAVEKIFLYYNSEELKYFFERLKKEPVTKDNIFYFEDACEKIRSQLEKQILEEPTIKEIEKYFESILKVKEKLIELTLYNSNKEIIKKNDDISKKIMDWQKYYSTKLHIETILPIKNDFLEIIKEYEIETVDFYKNKLKKTITLMITKELINQETIIIGKENNYLLRLIVKNPFEIVDEFLIDTDLENAEIISTNNNLKEILFGKNGKIVISPLNVGTTNIDFKIRKKIDVSEKNEIIYATNKDSLLQKKIFLSNEETINNGIIKIEKPQNLIACIITVNGNETSYSEEEQEISFKVENVNNKSLIKVNYYLKNKITIEKKIISTKNTSLENTELKYELIVKNNFNEKVNTTLIIDIGSQELIKKINVFDEIKTNKQKQIIGNELILKNQELTEHEIKKYELIIEISNIYGYYQLTLNQKKEELEKFNEIKLIEKINALIGIELTETNIKEIETVLKEAEKKILEHNLKINEELRIELLKKTLDEKIIQLEKYLSESEKLELNELNEEIKTKLENIQTLIDKNNLDKAFAESEKMNFSIDDEILKKSREVINNKKSENQELLILFGELVEKQNLIEKTISFDPFEAKKLFSELLFLEKQYFEEEERLNNLESEINKNVEDEINYWLEECKSKIKLLENELNIDTKKLLEIGFILPITIKRLEQIKVNLEKIENNKTVENLTKIKEIYFELDLAHNDIKKQVIRKYNFAIDAGLSSEILGKAKSSIDSNHYIGALLILKTENSISWISFIPIGIIVIVFGIIKIKFSKKRKENQKEKQEFIKQWED